MSTIVSVGGNNRFAPEETDVAIVTDTAITPAAVDVNGVAQTIQGSPADVTTFNITGVRGANFWHRDHNGILLPGRTTKHTLTVEE